MSSTRASIRAARAVAFGALGLLLAAALPLAAGAKDTVAFTLRDERITESSGLARDTAAQLYWTVNDSGSTGVVYGVGPNGRVRGTLNFRAAVRDVEAVAMHRNRLYVADIGDNAASADMVTVYAFTNPRASGLTVTYNAYDFRYPDGPHDAEALLVDADGRLTLVTKGARGGLYRAPRNPARDAVNVLDKVGNAPALVTDGTYLPDGRIALLTYSSVVVLDGRTYARVASATFPAQRQAESLTVSLDGRGLLVGSEGRGSKVYAVPVPGAAAPSPTPIPSAAPPADDGAGDDGTGAEDLDVPVPQANRGTLLAVGLAGVAALVAGLVVAFARRP